MLLLATIQYVNQLIRNRNMVAVTCKIAKITIDLTKIKTPTVVVASEKYYDLACLKTYSGINSGELHFFKVFSM